MDRQDTARPVTLPAKLIVSLKAGFVLALANVACVLIFSWAWMHVKAETKAIAVTGSAKKAIVSDLIVWSARISAVDPDLGKAFDALRAGNEKTLAFLKKEGIADNQIIVSSISTTKRRAKDDKGHELEKIVAYELTQEVQVRSADVNRVSDVARRITGLIKEGVMLESDSPRYLYTKM